MSTDHSLFVGTYIQIEPSLNGKLYEGLFEYIESLDCGITYDDYLHRIINDADVINIYGRYVDIKYDQAYFYSDEIKDLCELKDEYYILLNKIQEWLPEGYVANLESGVFTYFS